MTTSELLKKLMHVLETVEESKGRKRRDALKKILKKLKTKQKHLEEKCEDASGETKSKLAQKIDVVRAHRKKAIKTLRDLKKK
ncbi:iron-sulfur cluster co-chaperone HscB C-terminal domain-containing protein [Magnetovibrio sp.]|uniref:iron-sulfur cluster co-chaperone HscB C-terminal domain-containing protein n=1 Tax=Magnetovibrio sp. TaxID=2024836 RepID=UPI002F93B4FC